MGVTMACAPAVLRAPGPDYHLRVWVTDESQRPVPTAWFWTTATDGYRTHTDAAGFARAWRPLSIGFYLCAEAPGYRTGCALWSIPRDTDVHLMLKKATAQ